MRTEEENVRRVRDTVPEMTQERFQMDIMETYFNVRVIKHWNMLPSETVESSL